MEFDFKAGVYVGEFKVKTRSKNEYKAEELANELYGLIGLLSAQEREAILQSINSDNEDTIERFVFPTSGSSSPFPVNYA